MKVKVYHLSKIEGAKNYRSNNSEQSVFVVSVFSLHLISCNIVP